MAKVKLFKIFKNEIFQLFSNTSLHGCKYIVQEDSPVYIRIAWAVLNFTSFAISVCLVLWGWRYNSQNPTETVADTVHNPIWNYRFPAVTICNLNKISLTKTENFIRQIEKPKNFTDNYAKELMKYLVQLLYIQYDRNNDKYYEDLQTLLELNNLTKYELMQKVQPNCTELLKSCSLKNRMWRCDSLFEETVSSEGLCCSSNYYAFKNRFFFGYFSERYQRKPRRMSSCGYQSGYKILINNLPNDYLVASASSFGVKVLLHDSYDYPDWSSSAIIMSMSDQTFIGIVPTYSYATDAIKNLKSPERICVFSWEKSLKYFKKYSYSNCLTECRLDLIKERCGCVPYFYWSLTGTSNISLSACGVKDRICVAKSKGFLFSVLPGFNYKMTKEFNYESAESESLCKCQPSCEINEYGFETSRTIFSRKHAVNSKFFFGTDKLINHSVAHVYFKDLIGIRYRRDVTMSWYAELAWFGGLLGLFVGFSFTSGFEILYYLSVRVIIDYIYEKNSVNQLKTNKLQLIKKSTQKFATVYKISPVNFKEDKILVERTVPPLNKLYNLKQTNNPWFID